MKPGSYERAGQLDRAGFSGSATSSASAKRPSTACLSPTTRVRTGTLSRTLGWATRPASCAAGPSSCSDFGPSVYGHRRAEQFRADLLGQSDGASPLLGSGISAPIGSSSIRSYSSAPRTTASCSPTIWQAAWTRAGPMSTRFSPRNWGTGARTGTRTVPLAHRELARSAGEKRRLGLTMSDDEVAIEEFRPAPRPESLAPGIRAVEGGREGMSGRPSPPLGGDTSLSPPQAARYRRI